MEVFCDLKSRKINAGASKNHGNDEKSGGVAKSILWRVCGCGQKVLECEIQRVSGAGGRERIK